jgi:hypothetical protein
MKFASYCYDYDEEADIPNEIVMAGLPIAELYIPYASIVRHRFVKYRIGAQWIMKQARDNNKKYWLIIEGSLWDIDFTKRTGDEWADMFMHQIVDDDLMSDKNLVGFHFDIEPLKDASGIRPVSIQAYYAFLSSLGGKLPPCLNYNVFTQPGAWTPELFDVIKKPDSGIVAVLYDLGPDSLETISVSDYALAFANALAQLNPPSQYLGKVWYGLCGAGSAGEFARRIADVTDINSVVYDSGYKMGEFLDAGLSQLGENSEIILWRCAPWPYSMKEPRSLTTTSHGDGVDAVIKKYALVADIVLH